MENSEIFLILFICAFLVIIFSFIFKLVTKKANETNNNIESNKDSSKNNETMTKKPINSKKDVCVNDKISEERKEYSKDTIVSFKDFKEDNERVVRGFIHIVKSLYLFKDFRKSIEENFTNAEIGQRLIKYFKYFDEFGIVGDFYKMSNLYDDKDIRYMNFDFKKNLDGFLFFLLDFLQLQNGKGSTISPFYISKDQETSDNSDKKKNLDSDLTNMKKLLSMFAVFHVEYKILQCANYNTSIHRDFFIKNIIKLGSKNNSQINKENNDANKTLKEKLYHVFYVSFKTDNSSEVLSNSDLEKICNVTYNDKYVLKSFHVYYMGRDGDDIYRISCFKKDNVWIEMDTNGIVSNEIVAQLLCSGKYNIHLFYELV